MSALCPRCEKRSKHPGWLWCTQCLDEDIEDVLARFQRLLDANAVGSLAELRWWPAPSPTRRGA